MIPFLNRAAISGGRVFPTENLGNNRGINYHNGFTRLFYDALGSGTIKVQVEKDQDPIYLNKASCFKWLHGISEFSKLDQSTVAYQNFKNEKIDVILKQIQDRLDAKEDESVAKTHEAFAKIPETIKAVLNQMFEGTDYSPDTLPIYPAVLSEQGEKGIKLPKMENMTSPIMRGVTINGKPFIAIQVDCQLSDENLRGLKLNSMWHRERQQQNILLLYPPYPEGPLTTPKGTGDGKFLWDQVRGQAPFPSFFTSHFTFGDDGIATESQKENLKKVQTLLKTGTSADTNDLIWRIPKKGAEPIEVMKDLPKEIAKEGFKTKAVNEAEVRTLATFDLIWRIPKKGAEPIEVMKDLPKEIAKEGFKTKAVNEAEVRTLATFNQMPDTVRSVLTQLFEKSDDYSLDKLPIYPSLLREIKGKYDQQEIDRPNRKEMKSPVMRGVTTQGIPFIAIKVDCQLRDQDIETHAEKSFYENRRELQDVIFLFKKYDDRPSRSSNEKLNWTQADVYASGIVPVFFTSSFIATGGITESQKEHFNLIQNLLQKGTGPDVHGRIWTIPKET